jgi:ABC-type nitrate/sulfonate/bicarbonate transport system permease component
VGIGFFIWDAWNSSMISEIILALIYVGIVGFLLDRLMAYIAKLSCTRRKSNRVCGKKFFRWGQGVGSFF